MANPAKAGDAKPRVYSETAMTAGLPKEFDFLLLTCFAPWSKTFYLHNAISDKQNEDSDKENEVSDKVGRNILRGGLSKRWILCL
ncbi:MAG: hypothetical protein JG764_2141 [Clostridiales bacterium]|jgi:hypothetical protein|nr:hypothetical protein [Clostridiales bacterium]